MTQQHKIDIHPMVEKRKARAASNAAVTEEAFKMGPAAWNATMRMTKRSEYQKAEDLKKEQAEVKKRREEQEEYNRLLAGAIEVRKQELQEFGLKAVSLSELARAVDQAQSSKASALVLLNAMLAYDAALEVQAQLDDATDQEEAAANGF